MTKERESQSETTQQGESSPASTTDLARVRAVLQRAVDSGWMTEAEIQKCLEALADGTPLETINLSGREHDFATLLKHWLIVEYLNDVDQYPQFVFWRDKYNVPNWLLSGEAP